MQQIFAVMKGSELMNMQCLKEWIAQKQESSLFIVKLLSF